MRIFLVALIVLLCFGCKSELRSQYESVAIEINPIFLRLRPTAQKLRAAVAKKDERQIIQACKASDGELAQLAKMELYFDQRRAPKLEYGVHILASGFAEMRDSVCEELAVCERGECNGVGTGPGGRLTLGDALGRCASYCQEFLIPLLNSAEALRQRAKAEGVEIVSLTEP